MKKVIFTLLFCILTFSLVAQTTGSITLRGNVPGILEITVTPLTGYDNLDFATEANDLAIATVTERTNNKAGYQVTIESDNAVTALSDVPFFVGDDPTNTDTLEYAISYDGVPVSLVNGVATITDSNSKTTGLGIEKTVAISYTGTFLNEDGYSDTLTFTMTAK